MIKTYKIVKVYLTNWDKYAGKLGLKNTCIRAQQGLHTVSPMAHANVQSNVP